jgi:hypothetical protein
MTLLATLREDLRKEFTEALEAKAIMARATVWIVFFIFGVAPLLLISDVYELYLLNFLRREKTHRPKVKSAVEEGSGIASSLRDPAVVVSPAIKL